MSREISDELINAILDVFVPVFINNEVEQSVPKRYHSQNCSDKEDKNNDTETKRGISG